MRVTDFKIKDPQGSIHVLRRYLDPPNLPETPEEVFGSLYIYDFRRAVVPFILYTRLFPARIH